MTCEGCGGRFVGCDAMGLDAAVCEQCGEQIDGKAVRGSLPEEMAAKLDAAWEAYVTLRQTLMDAIE